MTKAEVKIFMKKVKEAGDKVLDEETAYIIYKNVPLDLAISSRLEEIEAFKAVSYTHLTLPTIA